jgi:phosphoglycerate dehydrogenase-like enzyme
MRDEALRRALFPEPLWARLTGLVDLAVPDVLTDFDRDDLADVEVLVTGWGCPLIDDRALRRMPALRLVAHTAGTVKGHVSPVCWEAGVVVTTAAAANGVPVAEFTLAQILLANKAVPDAVRRYAETRSFSPPTPGPTIGNYQRTVGIIGASTIGRRLIQLLRPFDLEVLLADPTVDPAAAERLGVRLVDLDELMALADVVSLHAPVLPSTIGMIGGRQLGLMRDGATFVNTARGVLVDHDALRAELATGRISAVLDVTDPEPLPADDVLFELPNVVLTPHLAGSVGTELHRMASSTLDEIEAYAAGLPVPHPVTAVDLCRMA